MGAFKKHESDAPAPKKFQLNNLGRSPGISLLFKIPRTVPNILELKIAKVFEASWFLYRLFSHLLSEEIPSLGSLQRKRS